MAPVEIICYLDVLSSWCYIGDVALQRIEQKYAEKVRVDWRIAQLVGGGPVPYLPERLKWYYARAQRISGVQLSAGWLDSPQSTTLHANQAAEAVRSLGVMGSQVRRAIAHAALIEGRPMGRRDTVLDEAARASGLPRERIDEAMRSAHVAHRITQSSREFDDLAFPQRPAFVIRDPIGDLAAISGLYTFESLDAIVGEMLHASNVTEEVGPEP